MLKFGTRQFCLVLALLSLSFVGNNAVAADNSVSAFETESNVNAVLSSQSRSSTFHETCTNVRVERDILSAECQRENGRVRRSSIEIRGIHNDNGNLEYTRNSRDPSTFQDTCRNIRISGARLSARCERLDGSYSRTSILIRGIHNNNGRLEYTRD